MQQQDMLQETAAQDHVISSDDNRPQAGHPQAGKWMPDEQGFYRYVTLPPAPVFQFGQSAQETTAEETTEEYVISSDETEEDVHYSVHIPFSIPKTMPEAVGGSFMLIAQQGMKHIKNFSLPELKMPEIKFPEIKLPEKTEKPVTIKKPRANRKKTNLKKAGKYEGPVIQGWTHKSVKPDYNSTVQRMKRVQAELKHSWQTFDPATVEKPVIKNDWDLPSIKTKANKPETDMAAKPELAQPATEARRKAQASGVSEPQKPAMADPVNDGLDDIFPMPITGFFMNDRDRIEPTPELEELPARVYEGELVIEEEVAEDIIEERIADEEISIDETIIGDVLSETFENIGLNLPAVIEPGYYLPEVSADVQETELAVQLMLRNNKILSNSISALTHRYFKNNDAQDDVPSFLY